jgi:hypothetical protein
MPPDRPHGESPIGRFVVEGGEIGEGERETGGRTETFVVVVDVSAANQNFCRSSLSIKFDSVFCNFFSIIYVQIFMMDYCCPQLHKSHARRQLETFHFGGEGPMMTLFDLENGAHVETQLTHVPPGPLGDFIDS